MAGGEIIGGAGGDRAASGAAPGICAPPCGWPLGLPRLEAGIPVD